MITCYVIDDEPHAVELLCDLILKTPGLDLIGHTTNPLIGLDLVTSRQAPLLTFVDINMPELSGIEFAELVNLYTTIIFTTAFNQFAVQAFEKEVFDYLLKPITKERFLKCISKYKKQLNNNPRFFNQDYFYIKGNIKGKMNRVNIKDIIYIEANLNYIKINTTNGETLSTYLTLNEIEEFLPRSSFSRIHRSFIVSNDKIKLIHENKLTLNDNHVITIGRSYIESFFEKVNKSVVLSRRIH